MDKSECAILSTKMRNLSLKCTRMRLAGSCQTRWGSSTRSARPPSALGGGETREEMYRQILA